MIHGNRSSRAAWQLRATVGLGAILAIFVTAVLAAGVATVEFQMPWKSIATVVAVAVISGVYRLRAAAARR